MTRNFLVSGDWNVLCDSCGRKFKASAVKKDWRGLMVCEEDYETRHESDFLRVQREKISVPFSRPPPAEDTFIGYICSVWGRFGMADIGTADCARADIVSVSAAPEDEDPLRVY